MPAPIVTIDPVHPQPRLIQRAVSMLEAGGILAYPTDTYYGLGCDIFCRRAVEQLQGLKQRPKGKPLSIIVPDLSHVAKYALVNNFAFKALRRMAPGPFTFVLPATRVVPEMMMNKQREVGIRIPDAPVAIALAAGLGRPIITTSAATPEGMPLLDAKDIKECMGHALDLILDGGVRPSEASTVLLFAEDRIELLRQGKGQVPGLEA